MRSRTLKRNKILKYYYTGEAELALGSAWRGFEGFELNSLQLAEDHTPTNLIPSKKECDKMVKNECWERGKVEGL